MTWFDPLERVTYADSPAVEREKREVKRLQGDLERKVRRIEKLESALRYIRDYGSSVESDRARKALEDLFD